MGHQWFITPDVCHASNPHPPTKSHIYVYTPRNSKRSMGRICTIYHLHPSAKTYITGMLEYWITGMLPNQKIRYWIWYSQRKVLKGSYNAQQACDTVQGPTAKPRMALEMTYLASQMFPQYKQQGDHKVSGSAPPSIYFQNTHMCLYSKVSRSDWQDRWMDSGLQVGDTQRVADLDKQLIVSSSSSLTLNMRLYVGVMEDLSFPTG